MNIVIKFFLAVAVLTMSIQVNAEQIGSCKVIPKSELESIIFEKVSPIFLERKAKLDKVVLSSDKDMCSTSNKNPELVLSPDSPFFLKMRFNFKLENGGEVTRLAEVFFQKQVWIASEEYKVNDLIEKSDLKTLWKSSNRLLNNESIFMDGVSSYKAQRHIYSGQELSINDLAQSNLIETGEEVVVRYQDGSIKLEVKGRAITAGNRDDQIKVLVDGQQHPIQAIIHKKAEVYVEN